MKLYKHFHTKEVVFEEDAEAYAMEQLGITIEPKGKGGSLTQEQVDFLGEFTEWYFSGNWIEEDEEDEVEDYISEMIDRKYQEMMERKWGI